MKYYVLNSLYYIYSLMIYCHFLITYFAWTSVLYYHVSLIWSILHVFILTLSNFLYVISHMYINIKSTSPIFNPGTISSSRYLLFFCHRNPKTLNLPIKAPFWFHHSILGIFCFLNRLAHLAFKQTSLTMIPCQLVTIFRYNLIIFVII